MVAETGGASEGRVAPTVPRVTEIARVLAHNERYAAGAPAAPGDPKPSRRLAVVTCMDARIDVFAVCGLELGDAHVIRNAGGRVTEGVLRSLALSVHVLEVDTVLVMQHTKCGLVGVTDEELRQLTGAELEFLAIDDHARAMREDMDRIAGTAYLSPITWIAGVVLDIETGRLHDLLRWERAGPS